MWRYLTTTKRCFMSTSTRSVGWWDHVGPAPKDPIIGVTEAFLNDPSPNKINLGVGAYRDDEGKPVVLQCVREAEAKIAGSEFLESISSAVSSKLVEESVKLVYGKDSDAVKEGRFAGVQALSGTGACRLFAEFQRRSHPESRIYLPDPTWSKMPQTVLFSYFILVLTTQLELTLLRSSGEKSQTNSRDAQAIRIFLEDGHLIGCAQSFAKNMGLYGHRVGCLSVLCADAKQAVAIKSQLQQIARAMYSSPPIHGMLLVSTILSDPDMKALWVKEVKIMANRIQKMRSTLRGCLEELGSSVNWEHITNQVGMFCFSGLTPDQVDQLVREYHIYMTCDGRISMAGVTTGNVSYLANSIHEVTGFGQEAKSPYNISL